MKPASRASLGAARHAQHKTDTNNSGAFSTDYIGMTDAYPEADYAAREKIIADHIRYDKGLLWTLANHPRVPRESSRSSEPNGGWPRMNSSTTAIGLISFMSGKRGA